MKGQVRWASNALKTAEGKKHAKEKLTEEAKERASKIDADGNGELSQAEITKTFEAQVGEGVHPEDSHRYHDANGDGVVRE
jgi:hypothetical protein